MTLLESLVTSGRIVDVALAFVVIEIFVLLLWRRRSGAGIAPAALLVNLGAGGSLMLALRASLSGAGWGWVAGWLVVALVFHVADLAQRWRSAGERRAHG